MNHICFICEENYAMPTRVAINSLKRHIDKTSGKEYACHVLSFGLSKSTIESITALSEPKFNVYVKIIDKKSYDKKLKNIEEKTHVTKDAFIKFDIPKIFPKYEKILYIDSDIIFQDDISDLFSIDLKDYYLAAVIEYWHIYRGIKYNFGKVYDMYSRFNSGLMLLNIPKMNKDNITDLLWSKTYKASPPVMDQSIFNWAVESNYCQLPIRYNFCPIFSGPYNLTYINKFYNKTYTSMNEVIEDIVAIHYEGQNSKPWKYKNVPMSDKWLHEYKLINGSIDKLSLETLNWKYYPEFKIVNIEKINRPISGLVSYLLCIIKNWKYYRKLFIKILRNK